MDARTFVRFRIFLRLVGVLLCFASPGAIAATAPGDHIGPPLPPETLMVVRDDGSLGDPIEESLELVR